MKYHSYIEPFGNGRQVFVYRTPLIACVVNNQSEICQFLLENGAQTDLQDQDGMTAFAVATVTGNIELCKLLIEYNAKIDIANNFGQ